MYYCTIFNSICGSLGPMDMGKLKAAQPHLVIGTPKALMRCFDGIPGLKNNDPLGLVFNGAFLKFLVLDEVSAPTITCVVRFGSVPRYTSLTCRRYLLFFLQ